MMTAFDARELARACRILFGREGAAFLDTLGPAQVKGAYRQRALETHPDRARLLGRSPEELAKGFHEVTAAYELLRTYLEKRPAPSAKATATSAKQPPEASAAPARSTPGASPRPAAASPRPAAASPRPAAASPRPAAASPHPAAASPHPAAASPHPAAASPHPAAASPGPAAASAAAEECLPSSELPLAQFLYYSGRVSWDAVVRSICWQRRQRPRFGEIARRWGYLSPADVSLLLKAQQGGERLGETAVRLGALRPVQCDAILWAQRRVQKPIGQYFIDAGLLRADELERFLEEQRRHNVAVRRTDGGGTRTRAA